MLLASSTVVLTILLEMGLRVAFLFVAPARLRLDLRDYGRERLEAAYPGWTSSEFVQLMGETYVPWAYDAYTTFRERPRRGRYVNVSPAGFREGREHHAWPPTEPATTVFVFGGSTTFGYGLPDDQTIPSQLQEVLSALCGSPVTVYNFGCGQYYSTQERILFERLVGAGHAPGAVVFIDGINEGATDDDTHALSAEVQRLFENRQGMAPWSSSAMLFLHHTAIGRLAQRITRASRTRPPVAVSPAEQRRTADLQARRWLSSKRMIAAAARAQGITPVFVIQPGPYYRFDLSTHPFKERIESSDPAGPFYRSLEACRMDPTMGDVVWLADIQEGRSGRDLYLDDVHYTARFSRELAERVAQEVVARWHCGGPAVPGTPPPATIR